MPDTLEWIAPDGATTEFLVDADGVTGRFSPPVDRDEDDAVGAGSWLRNVRHAARDVVVVIEILGSNALDTRQQIRALAATLNPLKGDGKLRSTAAADGAQRELICQYAAGLETAAEKLPEGGPTNQRAPLVFRATDPYWYDSADNVESWTPGSSTALFFPVPPIRLTSSEVFAQATIANDGDVDAWPVWIITGPGVDPLIRNTTTGEMLSLPITLAAGDSVTIDTRAGRKTVTAADGSNLWPELTDDSSLFPLAPGSTAVQLEMTGATADSSLQLNYRRAFLAP